MILPLFDTVGGRPRDYNTPFTFLAEGMEDAFQGVFSMFGTDPKDGVILSGCKVTTPAASTPADPNTADVASGYIYLEGEICWVPASTDITKTGSEDFVFDIKEEGSGVFLPFAAGSTDMIRVRTGELRGEDNATSGNFMPVDAMTYFERLNGRHQTSGLTYLVGSGGGSWSGLSGNWMHDYYNEMFHLELSGSSTLSGADATHLKIKLPEDINGNQIECLGAVGGIGTYNSFEVMRISKEVFNPEYLEIYKSSGNFTVGALQTMRINLQFKAGAV